LSFELFISDGEDQNGDGISVRSQDIITIEPDGEPMSIDDASTTLLLNELSTSPSHWMNLLRLGKYHAPFHQTPVSGEKETASETARSPSPAASSTSSQRLAGPGHTPARVERILSENTTVVAALVADGRCGT
jgi:hypothetical protein